MPTIVYPNGTKEITIPASSKIAMYSESATKLYQQINDPNQPSIWTLYVITTAGTEYVSAAFSVTTKVRIDARADNVLYAVGTTPSTREPIFDIAVSATAATATDVFEVEQSGVLKQMTVEVLEDFLGDGLLEGVTAAEQPSQFESPTLSFPDTLRASVEAATGGKMTVLYDNQGYPSSMVRIPAFNMEDIDADLGTGRHPAFVVNGVDKAEIFIGAFQARNYNSRACSLPGLDPTVSATWDNASLYCTNKGSGWHLMTNWEWAAVSWWIIKQVDDSILAAQPRGNTNYGRAYDEYQETGTRQDGGTYDPGEALGNARILNGSGPLSFRHDGTIAGISDLVGNIWEWVGGLKLDDGRIYMPSDNYYSQVDTSWAATLAYFENDTGALQLSDTAGVVDASISVTWDALTMDAGYDGLALATRKQMVAALIAPRLTNAAAAPLTEEANGTLNANTSGERLPLRGGDWGYGAHAGVGALHLSFARSLWHPTIGFRPAFVAP